MYYFQRVTKSSGENLLICLDISQDLYFFYSFLMSSAVICGLAVVLVFLLLLLLSKKVVSPIVKTYAKQKSFITDMSHELKTPLAIVKANTQVMELEHGTSSWSKSNHKQIEKLSLLINRLLSLAKLEEETGGVQVLLSFSNLVEEAGENFYPLVEQEEKELSIQVSPCLNIVADSNAMNQLVDILLENAIKYSTPASVITLSLTQEKHSVVLEVKNEGEHLKKGSYDNWFQRFFREEGSRNSETGGFGLGLSMAKTLVKQQGGKISAYSPEGKTAVLRVEFKKSGKSHETMAKHR